MSGAVVDLKVLISVIQNSQNNVKTAVSDLKSLLTQLGIIDNSSLKQIGTKLADVNTHLKEGADNAKKLATGFDVASTAGNKLEAGLEKIFAGAKLLAGGFLAFESVRFVKDIADTAARAQVLATVLNVVGHNAGYTTEELQRTDKQVQRLGITATSSRQSLTQFVQAGFDLRQAPKLARTAQDAAVILGVNSSEAFSRLVTAVQIGNTEMLRNMGIVVNVEQAYNKFALTIGKTGQSLNERQRAQARLNATLEEGVDIIGAHSGSSQRIVRRTTPSRLQSDR